MFLLKIHYFHSSSCPFVHFVDKKTRFFSNLLDLPEKLVVFLEVAYLLNGHRGLALDRFAGVERVVGGEKDVGVFEHSLDPQHEVGMRMFVKPEFHGKGAFVFEDIESDPTQDSFLK